MPISSGYSDAPG
ncbi:hypothetical protein NPIL_252801, partial [Nephila pilipes]